MYIMLRSSSIHSFSSMFANLSIATLEIDIHKSKSRGFKPLSGRYRGIVHPDSRFPCVKSLFSIQNKTVPLRGRRFRYSVMTAPWISPRGLINKKTPTLSRRVLFPTFLRAKKILSHTPNQHPAPAGKRMEPFKCTFRPPVCVLVSRL